MVARTNPTGVLIVSFERDGNESNTASVWTVSVVGRNSILANFAELQAGDQLFVSDESL